MARQLLTLNHVLYFHLRVLLMPCTQVHDMIATPTNNTLLLKSGDFPSLSDALNYAGSWTNRLQFLFGKG